MCFIKHFLQLIWGLPWWLKKLPAIQVTRFRSLGWEDPLWKEMATHYSMLAWRMPWTEEPGGLQSMGLQRVGHDWVTFTFTFHDQWKNEWVHVLCHYKYYKHSSISTPSFVLGLGQLPFSLCFMRNYKHFSYIADFFSGYCLWSPHCWAFLLFHRENRGHQKVTPSAFSTQLTLTSVLIHRFLSFFREVVWFLLFEEIAKFMLMLSLTFLTHLHLLISWFLRLSPVSMTALTVISVPTFPAIPFWFLPFVVHLSSHPQILMFSEPLNFCLHPQPFP